MTAFLNEFSTQDTDERSQRWGHPWYHIAVKVVLDTAALISAIRSSTGAAAEIVRLAAVRKLTLLMDYKLVCEYRDVSLRPQRVAASGRAPEDAEATIEMLEAIATPVLVRVKHRPLSQDGNDDMVLDVAINGQADVVVTNNIKDFRGAAERFGIEVMTPREFLIAFRKGEYRHAS
jgi:putative PIN family toxin of toxin-antitoxin system